MAEEAEHFLPENQAVLVAAEEETVFKADLNQVVLEFNLVNQENLVLMDLEIQVVLALQIMAHHEVAVAVVQVEVVNRLPAQQVLEV